MKRIVAQWCSFCVALGLCAIFSSQAAAQLGAKVAAGGAPAKPAVAASEQGLHLPQDRQVGMTPYTANDGGGYRWDLYFMGQLISQTGATAYSQAMMINAGGARVMMGFVSANGDEVEVGPFSMGNGVQLYRRIKIYKDAPLARWLDIFVNTTAAEAKTSCHITTNFARPITSSLTSSGDKTLAKGDWALITGHAGALEGPFLLHVFSDRGGKATPDIRFGGNVLTNSIPITLAPRATAIVCNFMSQTKTEEQARQFMNGFRPGAYLTDLPPTARRMIVNMTRSQSLGLVLARIESSDTIRLTRGDVINGTISNASIELQTLLGPLALPAEKVVGMDMEGMQGQGRALLTDGQIVCGAMGDQKLQVKLATGGEVAVPLSDIKQWSFKISDARPKDVSIKPPYVELRTGDWLQVDPSRLQAAFRTRYGVIKPATAQVAEIRFNQSNSLQQLLLVNGSTIDGVLADPQLGLAFTLGKSSQIPSELLVRVSLAPVQDGDDDDLISASMVNGDVLRGALAAEQFKLQSDFGPMDVQVKNIRSLNFNPASPRRAVVELWDSSVHRGYLQGDELDFQVSPGAVLKLPVNQVLQMTRFQSLPPDDIVKKVNQLVARLSAESFQDRQSATDELVKLGAGIVPVLRKYGRDMDPEIRVRVQAVINTLQTGSPKKDADPNVMQPMMFN